MSILEIAQQVSERHQGLLSKKAADGQIRAMELLWQQNSQRVHGMKMPAFTDRERGNLKYLIEQLGAEEANFLLSEAVEHWVYLRGQPSLDTLPPTPTFGALFAFRETIRSYLHSRGKVVGKGSVALEKLKGYEAEVKVEKAAAELEKKPKLSLLEMVQAEREKVRNAR